MIAIISRPFFDTGVQKSNWVASNSPIVYELETNGWVLAKGNNQYYIYVDVFEVSTNKKLGRMKIAPFFGSSIDTFNPIAQFTVDISSIVRTYLRSAYHNLGVQNYKDDTLNVFIRFSEYVLSEMKSEYTDEANPLYIIQAVNQFGYPYGSNMLEYVPFGTGAPKAKFLTAFKEPIAYAGYPFTLSFIYSEWLGGAQLIRVDEQLDLNKNVITTTQAQLNTTQSRRVNFLNIESNPDPTAEFENVWLETGIIVADGYVDSGYVNINYTE